MLSWGVQPAGIQEQVLPLKTDVLKQGVNLGHCFSSSGQSEVNVLVVSERLCALLPTVLASLLEGAAHAI